MTPNAISAAYLVAAVLFILGLKRLSSPATARSGNELAAVGMLIAVVATLVSQAITSYGLIALGMVAGAAVGAVSARTVRMTAMPQMVALFNGVGGGAAALVAAAEFRRLLPTQELSLDVAVSIMLSTVIGAISFAGSLVAFAKLQEWMTGRPVTYPLQTVVNGALAAAIVLLIVYLLVDGSEPPYVVLVILALLLGVAFVLPIGGADMPVVISLLNAFTGVAAATTGFVLSNNVLIVSGALVGASGTLLTRMMSRAMGRSLGNVLFGAFGAAKGAEVGAASGPETRPVRSAGPDDVATLLAYARSVVIVPGYGMAVAQAQHAVRELADLLEKRGVDVKYAIHPVAGRMPGHMNVLLAEANVPYPQLYEMDDINPQFAQTDVALVIGANDVTNPGARNSPGSPIYGMPILDVDQAANVVVLKRSMNPGFAGIDNELYYNPKTIMLFGDAKESIVKLVNAVKNV
jgi:NAD(P) transhydrogenase subunit beta